jgi:hypothetical protein
MRGRWLAIAAVATALLLVLFRTASPPRPLNPLVEPQPAPQIGAAFDAGRCGTIRGFVSWSGPVPAVDPIELKSARTPPGSEARVHNPNGPEVRDGRLANAIVYLTGVDPRRSAPWHPAPTSIDVSRAGLTVRQADRASRTGVVRRGDEVAFVSREAADSVTQLPALHSIRGRGAAFFTQMLPVPDGPVNRTFPDPGIVELSSGSSYYWLRAYVLVSDHPYATVTGPDGRFAFENVPDGDYELVCWVPNWHIERFESDPELSVYAGPARLVFRPAVERRMRVSVKSGRASELGFTLSPADFNP